MTTMSVMTTNDACRLGITNVRIQAMADSAGVYRPGIALGFTTDRAAGLAVTFHGSAAEAREFARQLVIHCDAADEAHAQATQRAAA